MSSDIIVGTWRLLWEGKTLFLYYAYISTFLPSQIYTFVSWGWSMETWSRPHDTVQQHITSNSDLPLAAISQQQITIVVIYRCREILDKAATALPQPPYVKKCRGTNHVTPLSNVNTKHKMPLLQCNSELLQVLQWIAVQQDQKPKS